MKVNLKKQGTVLVASSNTDAEQLLKLQDAIYEVDFKNNDTRTIQQNKSIHLWCEMIAYHLNTQGFVIQDVIKLNTNWNMIKVKEMIFKPVVKSLYTKDSTTQLNKGEFELIIDTIILALSKKGVEDIPDFPNREDLEKITKENK